MTILGQKKNVKTFLISNFHFDNYFEVKVGYLQIFQKQY